VTARPSPSGATGGTPPAQPLTIGGPPHFTVFGVPVRVGMGFWVMSALFGLMATREGAPTSESVRRALTWTAIVFVSIMVHELGHALVVRRFGGRPAITLHALGGLTNYQLTTPLSRPRRILVSLAGPFAGFALGLVVFLVTRNMSLSGMRLELVRMVLWVNVGWGIINLLPVVPLDGGNVLAAALGPRRAFATAVISAVVGIGTALAGFILFRSLWLAFLFGTAAVSAISQARAAWSTNVDVRDGLEDSLQKAKDALGRGALDDAYLFADDVVRRARTAPMRNGGYTALAWIHLAKDEGRLAREALSHIEPREAIDPYTYAAVEDAAGDPRRAREVLEEARRAGVWNGEMTKLLIDLYAREGNLERAVEVATEDVEHLGADELRAVVRAAIDGHAYRHAATLAGRLFEIHGAQDDALDEARALSLMGDAGSALAAIAHAMAAGPVDPATLREDPAFAALASDERFLRLIEAASPRT